MTSPTESEKIRAMQEWIDRTCPHSADEASDGSTLPEQEVVHCSKVLQEHIESQAGSPLLGSVIGLSLHGAGTYGIVFRAVLVNGNKVGIKVLRPSAQLSITARHRFELEGAALQRCRVPGVVPVLEVGQIGDLHYIVMEFADGGNLAAQMAGWTAPIPVASIAALMTNLAEALHLAHQQGIIHRDLKPSNILLRGGCCFESEGCQALLGDFGLARDLSGDTRITATGTTPLVGTVAYMSPEQALGRSWETTTASDIFSLGVIFYELLTLHRPFTAPSRVETLYKIAFSDPPSLRTLNRDVSRDIEAIVYKCLAKRPQDRYASAAALASDLRAWKLGHPISAQHLTSREQLWRWSVRNPLLATLSALLVTCLVSFAVVGTWLYARAQSALVLSQQEHARADKNLELALSAVTEMGQFVAEETLLDVPNANEKRLEIHEKGLAFFKQFAEQASNDTLSVKRLAVAYHFAANAAHQVPGKEDLEWELRERQAELLMQLISQEPTNASLHFAMFHNRFPLGIRENMGHLNFAAEEHLRKAIELAPDRREYQAALPAVLSHIAEYADVDPAERTRYLTEAIALCRANTRVDPENMDAHKNLIAVQLVLVRDLLKQHRTEEAMVLNQQTLDYCEEHYHPMDEPYSKMSFQAWCYDIAVGCSLERQEIELLPKLLKRQVEHNLHFAQQQTKYRLEAIASIRNSIKVANLLREADKLELARDALQNATDLRQRISLDEVCSPEEVAELTELQERCQLLLDNHQ